jgi:ActR/RegA family two-component response regulator
LDVRLGDGPSGIEVCREIRSSQPEASCIMLTGFDGNVAGSNLEQAAMEVRHARRCGQLD